MTTPTWYFAYGSNMNPARVSQRGMPFDAVCGAVLEGVRLSFDKQSRTHAGSGTDFCAWKSVQTVLAPPSA